MTKTLVGAVLLAIGFTAAFVPGCESGSPPGGAGGSGGATAAGPCEPCIKAQACCVALLGVENCPGEQLQECISLPAADRTEILSTCTTFTMMYSEEPGCKTTGGGGAGGSAR